MTASIRNALCHCMKQGTTTNSQSDVIPLKLSYIYQFHEYSLKPLTSNKCVEDNYDTTCDGMKN